MVLIGLGPHPVYDLQETSAWGSVIRTHTLHDLAAWLKTCAGVFPALLPPLLL